MNSQSAADYLDSLVDQAAFCDDYAFLGALHVLRDALAAQGGDTARLNVLCRAAEYLSEARIEADPPRGAPGARVRLRSRAVGF